MTMTDRVQEARKHLTAMRYDQVQQLCHALLLELGDGQTENERMARTALAEEDYDQAKLLCLLDPCSPYLAAISCIASAFRSPTVADSVLRDAARHVTEVAKQRCAERIAIAFTAVLPHQHHL